MIPVDRPTVREGRDHLEQHDVRRSPAVSASSATVAATTSGRPTSRATVRACRAPRSAIRRSKAWTSGSPRTSAQMTKTSSSERGHLDAAGGAGGLPPPMNISTSVPSSVPSFIGAVVEAVEARGARHHGLEEPGQQPGRPRRAPPRVPRVAPLAGGDERPCPARSSAPRSPTSVILVCSAPPARRRSCAAQLEEHREPEPAQDHRHRDRQADPGSVANRIRLSEYSANPALLKAETAWKTPR